MTPTELRSLARKVSEDKYASRHLADEVLLHFKWRRTANDDRFSPDYRLLSGGIGRPNPLISIEAANSLLPKGWRLLRIDFNQGNPDRQIKPSVYVTLEEDMPLGDALGVSGHDLPHAMTAAAILAKSSDMENEIVSAITASGLADIEGEE